VIGPAATRERIAAAYRSCADESGPDLEAAFDFTPITLGPSQLGPFKVTSVRVNHPVPAYALRVEAGGRSLVYSGDTGPCEALEDLAGGADLALFEASNLTGPAQAPNLHMTAAQAANHARAAKVGSLVLTHLVTWNDRRETFAEARDIFKGELALATPGMVVDL
jgi:ribonuclease BN (tRNA processing enzyme)